MEAVWRKQYRLSYERRLVTIDLDKELTPEELAQTEDFANREIWLDKPISVSYVPHTALDNYTMRKKNTGLTGTLRW